MVDSRGTKWYLCAVAILERSERRNSTFAHDYRLDIRKTARQYLYLYVAARRDDVRQHQLELFKAYWGRRLGTDSGSTYRSALFTDLSVRWRDIDCYVNRVQI